MKKLLLVGIPVLALAAVVALGFHFVVDTNSAVACYVQVDNTRAEPDGQDAGEYKYTLNAYDASGGEQEVEFKTPRLLRDQAYLMLETMPIRGVISWEEVQLEDVPDKARAALEAA